MGFIDRTCLGRPKLLNYNSKGKRTSSEPNTYQANYFQMNPMRENAIKNIGINSDNIQDLEKISVNQLFATKGEQFVLK